MWYKQQEYFRITEGHSSWVSCPCDYSSSASDLLFLKQRFSIRAVFLPGVMQLLHIFAGADAVAHLGWWLLLSPPPQPRQEYFVLWEVAAQHSAGLSDLPLCFDFWFKVGVCVSKSFNELNISFELGSLSLVSQSSNWDFSTSVILWNVGGDGEGCCPVLKN